MNFGVALLSYIAVTTANTPDISIYTLRLGNHISLRGVVNQENVDRLLSGLQKIKEKEVVIYIDSSGGYVEEGDRFLTQLQYRQREGTHFTCIAQKAHSMAFYIMQYCDKRLVTENARMMMHHISTTLMGTLPAIEGHIRMVRQMANRIYHKCAERLGLTPEEFEKKIAVDWWLSGDDIIQAGAADGVTLVGCSSILTTSIHDTGTLYGTVCPLA